MVKEWSSVLSGVNTVSRAKKRAVFLRLFTSMNNKG